MTLKNYKERCDSLFKKAKSFGLELRFQPENFQPARLNCLWYGGSLAKIKVSSSLTIELGVYGDVYATLYDRRKENDIAFVKDKSNTGRFFDEMRPYIKNDVQLEKFIQKGRLVFQNNNWVEYDGIVYENEADVLGRFVDLGIITDNILDDNILDAIESAINYYKDIVTDIEFFSGGKSND